MVGLYGWLPVGLGPGVQWKAKERGESSGSRSVEKVLARWGSRVLAGACAEPRGAPPLL